MPRDDACRKCSLGELVRTTCVWGNRIKNGERAFSYSRQAEVMLVGEAPGSQEDDQGSPFVGPSGQILFSTLKRLGLPENYYVTNIVKCFPRGKPSSTHVAACKSYLQEELEQVKPRWILALGNTAWHYFGSGPITEHAGRETHLEHYTVLPALHPAAILRDPNRRSAWEADLARFVRLVAGGLVEAAPIKVSFLTDEGWEAL